MPARRHEKAEGPSRPTQQRSTRCPPFPLRWNDWGLRVQDRWGFAHTNIQGATSLMRPRRKNGDSDALEPPNRRVASVGVTVPSSTTNCKVGEKQGAAWKAATSEATIIRVGGSVFRTFVLAIRCQSTRSPLSRVGVRSYIGSA
jgi:hypothetical protein